MAPLSTPQQILAGAGPADAAPNASPMTPPGSEHLQAQPDLLSGAISALPPAPQPGGVSESPRDQLLRMYAKNSDNLISQASDPNAPGAWARALVGGMQSALAGVGNVGEVPKGTVSKLGGALYGIGKVSQANQAEDAREQERKDRLKQQKFENDEKLKDDERKEEAQNYERGMRYMQTQSYLSKATTEAQDAIHKDTASYRKAHEEGGARLVQDDLTSADLQQLAKEHATPEDPKGTNWLMKQNVFQSGWKDERDDNGDIIPRYNEQGDVIGSARRQTYGIYTWGDERKVDLSFAKDIHDYLHKEITNETTLKPKDARTLEVQLEHAKAEEQAGLVALAAAGKTKDEIRNYQHKADFEEGNRAFLPWLSDAKNDPGLALTNMAQHAQEVGADGKPTAEAIRAQEDYNQVVRGLGEQIVKQNMDTYEKTTIENIKANAAAAKNAPLQVEGDPKLHGEAYINSLPQGRQGIIRQVVSGQINGISPRLLAGKDGQQLMAEAAQADPDLDTAQIAGYPALVKAFNVGKEAQQIKAINTAVPHLNDLYTALESGTLTTIPGVGWVERKFGNQNAIDVETLRSIASQELAKIYATNAVTDQEHKVFDEQLQGFKTAGELEGTLYSMVTALDRQKQSLDNQWQQGLPSPHWNPKRAVIDPETQHAMDNIISLHSGKGPLPPPFSVQTPDGQTHTFKNQQQVDQFNAAVAAAQAGNK